MNDDDVVMVPAGEFREWQRRVEALETLAEFWAQHYGLALPAEQSPTQGQQLAAGLAAFREARKRRTA